MDRTLRPPKAPNLPVGPVEYEQNYQNQLNNVQRLYYNSIDNTLSSLMENSGGRFMNFPNLFMCDTNKQYATGNNTPTLIQFNVTTKNEGFVVTSTSANPIYSGAYRVDYRMLLENNDAAQQNVWVWLQKNASDVDNSCAKYSVGSGQYTTVSGSIELDLTGADTLQLYWATSKAANSAGTLTGVWMDSYTSSTSPFTRPAIPSAYGSITFVSELSQ